MMTETGKDSIQKYENEPASLNEPVDDYGHKRIIPTEKQLLALAELIREAVTPTNENAK